MSEKDLITQEKSGTITFANDVLEIIVGVAASDIPGVAGMSGGIKDGIVEMLGRKNFTKGILCNPGRSWTERSTSGFCEGRCSDRGSC